MKETARTFQPDANGNTLELKLLVLLVLVLAVEAETVKFYYVFKDIEFDIGVDIGDDGVVGVGKVIEFCRFMGGMYRNFVKFYKLLSKY